MTDKRTILLAAALLTAAAPAAAQEPLAIGRNNDWVAYTYLDQGKKVCYMASAPTKSEGNYSKRGHVYALVTHHHVEKSSGVVSIVTGYDYKPGSNVSVEIGGKTFTLFTEGDRAWSSDTGTDKAIVDAMVKANAMTVEGVSARGTKTRDTYSLRGFTATKKLIDRACNR